MTLKRVLCELYEEHPFYGYRKMVRALRDQGFDVGKKLVRRLKRDLGLKTMYPEPKTSIPNKAHKKYPRGAVSIRKHFVQRLPHLLRDVEIARINQVWSADLCPLRVHFIYPDG